FITAEQSRPAKENHLVDRRRFLKCSSVCLLGMGRSFSAWLVGDPRRYAAGRPPQALPIAGASPVPTLARFRLVRLLLACGVLLAASAAIYMVGAAVPLIFVIGTTILLGIRQIRSYELLVQARAENAQKAQLDAALNNMRQGLQMYDANG